MKQKTYLNPSDLYKIELRARAHWQEQKAKYPLLASDWPDYWRANHRTWTRNAKMFMELLSPENFDQYLDSPDVNPWTLYNIQTMNG